MSVSRPSRAVSFLGPAVFGAWMALPAAGMILVLLMATASQGAAITAPGGCRLTLDIPKGFSARPHGASLVLHPIGQEGRRSVFAIRLTPGQGGDAALTERRPLGAAIARYRVTRETVGSGGEETTLVAEAPHAGGVVRLEASVQRDDGAEPDFEPAWSALASARCTETR